MVALAALRTGLTALILPVAHHALVLACRVTLVAVEQGLPDVEERERLQACIVWLCTDA